MTAVRRELEKTKRELCLQEIGQEMVMAESVLPHGSTDRLHGGRGFWEDKCLIRG